jgi:competence ComEA-like helix-hairpin-helix protein
MDAPAPNPALPPSPPTGFAAWPRSAQLATAFVVGVAVTALAARAISLLGWGSRPTDLARRGALAYRVELNRADHAELVQLPGVGESLAGRIEDHRREHGPFRSVDDLSSVKGVGPATVNRLRGWVQIDGDDGSAPPRPKGTSGKSSASGKSGPAAPLDVNGASPDELRLVPGIGPVRAQRIVEERRKRPFASVDELERVPGIKGKTLEKLRPFLTVTSPSPQSEPRPG